MDVIVVRLAKGNGGDCDCDCVCDGLSHWLLV